MGELSHPLDIELIREPAPSRSHRTQGVSGTSSDEPHDNINYSMFTRVQLTEGQQAFYYFDEGPITFFSVMPDGTYGLVTGKVEVLHGQSEETEGTELPEGMVFQFMNIYLGYSGWADGRISSPVINFAIPDSWFQENNIDPASVRLFRYHDGEWQAVPTRLTGQEGGYYQFAADTPGFSSFVIIGQPRATDNQADPGSVDGPVEDIKEEAKEETPDKKGIPGFGMALGVAGLLIAFNLRRK